MYEMAPHASNKMIQKIEYKIELGRFFLALLGKHGIIYAFSSTKYILSPLYTLCYDEGINTFQFYIVRN